MNDNNMNIFFHLSRKDLYRSKWEYGDPVMTMNQTVAKDLVQIHLVQISGKLILQIKYNYLIFSFVAFRVKHIVVKQGELSLKLANTNRDSDDDDDDKLVNVISTQQETKNYFPAIAALS